MKRAGTGIRSCHCLEALLCWLLERNLEGQTGQGLLVLRHSWSLNCLKLGWGAVHSFILPIIHSTHITTEHFVGARPSSRQWTQQRFLPEKSSCSFVSLLAFVSPQSVDISMLTTRAVQVLSAHLQVRIGWFALLGVIPRACIFF